LRAMRGDAGIIECSYVASEVSLHWICDSLLALLNVLNSSQSYAYISPMVILFCLYLLFLRWGSEI
jgi:hypothetical protein